MMLFKTGLRGNWLRIADIQIKFRYSYDQLSTIIALKTSLPIKTENCTLMSISFH